VPEHRNVLRPFALLILVTAALGTALAAGIDEPRAGELRHLLVQECGSCHGLTMRGGLGPALTPEALTDRDDIYLRAVILHGVPGTPMPPWSWKLSEEEADWLVNLLREGVQ
jgi:cytochrome c55X